MTASLGNLREPRIRTIWSTIQISRVLDGVFPSCSLVDRSRPRVNSECPWTHLSGAAHRFFNQLRCVARCAPVFGEPSRHVVYWLHLHRLWWVATPSLKRTATSSSSTLRAQMPLSVSVGIRRNEYCYKYDLSNCLHVETRNRF